MASKKPAPGLPPKLSRLDRAKQRKGIPFPTPGHRITGPDARSSTIPPEGSFAARLDSRNPRSAESLRLPKDTVIDLKAIESKLGVGAGTEGVAKRAKTKDKAKRLHAQMQIRVRGPSDEAMLTQVTRVNQRLAQGDYENAISMMEDFMGDKAGVRKAGAPQTPDVRTDVYGYWTLSPANRKKVDAAIRRIKKSTPFVLGRFVYKAKKGERVGGKYIARFQYRDSKGNLRWRYIYAHQLGQLLSQLSSNAWGHLGLQVGGHEVMVDRDANGKLHVGGREISEGQLRARVSQLHQEGVKELREKRLQELEAVRIHGTKEQQRRLVEETERQFAGSDDWEAIEGQLSRLGLWVNGGYNEKGTPVSMEDVASIALTEHEDILPEVSPQWFPGNDVVRFPVPDEENGIHQLFPHQAEAAARIRQAWDDGDGFLLQDEAGLGKTITALASLQHYDKDGRHLIVVPTSGKHSLMAQWQEAAKLYGWDLKDPTTDTGPGLYIASYDELYDTSEKENAFGEMTKTAELRAEFATGWGAVVFDESHSMSNPSTSTAQAGVELQNHCDKALYMSATPMTKLTDCHYLRKLGWFEGGEEFLGWAEGAGAIVNRRKFGPGDIPFDIQSPTSTVPTVIVAAQMLVEGKGMRRTPRLDGDIGMSTDFHKIDEDAQHEKMMGTAEEVASIAASWLGGYATGGLMALYRKQAWEITKAKHAVEAAKKEMAEGRQVLITTAYTKHDHNVLMSFARQIAKRIPTLELQDPTAAEQAKRDVERIKDMVEALPKVDIMQWMSSQLGGPGVVGQIHGRAEGDAKEVQRAYQRGELKVVIGSIHKAGTGLSFHDNKGNAARTQINLSLPWSGTKFRQVAGRSHRTGSQSSTRMIWMQGEHDSEKRAAAIVARKLASMGALVQGDPDSLVTEGILANWELAHGEDLDAVFEALEAEVAGDPMPDKPRNEAEVARMHFRQAVDEIRAGGDPLAAQGERLSGKRRKEEDRRNRIAAGQLMKKENVRIEPDGLFFRVHGAVPGTKLFKDFAWRKAGAKYDASTRTWLVSDPHLFYAVAKNVGHYEKVGGGADAVQDWSKQGLHTAWVQHGSKQQPGAKAARRTMAKQAMALHEAMQQTNDPKEKKRLAFRLQRLQRLHSAGGRGASIRRATKAEAGWPAVVKADQAVPLSSARVQVQPPKATRKKYPFQGYIDFQGLQIDVENRAGSTRSGTDADGNEWSVQMHAHYGEIRGTEGTDGDKLDVYVGPLADSSLVVVVHQADPKDGSYDEDKVMLGFATKESALACYNKQYDTPGYYGGCTVLSIGEFWRWVEDRNNRGRKVIAAVDPVAVGARTGLTLKASTVIKAKAANVGEVRRRKDGDYRKFPDGSWRLIRSTAERKEAKQLVDPHRRASSRVVGEGASAVAIPKHAKGGSWGEAAFYLPPEYRGDLDKAKPGKAPKPTVVQYKNKAGETITRYEYPPEWTEKASKYKFARVAHILAQLETISSELKREFTNKGLDAATRANAAALYLTLHQGTRPGGAGETRGEPTYGITNLQRRHVAIHKDGTVELQYRGKSGVSRTVAMKDMQLAETIREFMGGRDQVNSKKPLWPANRQAMAERLKQYNEHFKVKDLRTAVAMRIGTKAVEEVLQQEWDTKTKTKAKRAAKAIVKEIATKVSQQLGNTPSVAQKNYLAPELFETALEMAGIDPKVLQ